MRQQPFTQLIFVAGILVGLIVGIASSVYSHVFDLSIDAVTQIPTEPPPRQLGEIPIHPHLIFNAQPGPDVDTLHTITAGANSNEEALAQVVHYFDTNRERLQALWREEHQERLAALYAMYVVHISQPYGETVGSYSTLLEFLDQERGQCASYSQAQGEISSALGLVWRELADTDWHNWIEVEIDNHWEVFDSTVNVWIDQPVEALLSGGPREYRMFYTPMEDINRPDARWHLQEGPYGYNMPNLRHRVIGYGIYWWPHGAVRLIETNATS